MIMVAHVYRQTRAPACLATMDPIVRRMSMNVSLERMFTSVEVTVSVSTELVGSTVPVDKDIMDITTQ